MSTSLIIRETYEISTYLVCALCSWAVPTSFQFHRLTYRLSHLSAVLSKNQPLYIHVYYQNVCQQSWCLFNCPIIQFVVQMSHISVRINVVFPKVTLSSSYLRVLISSFQFSSISSVPLLLRHLPGIKALCIPISSWLYGPDSVDSSDQIWCIWFYYQALRRVQKP